MDHECCETTHLVYVLWHKVVFEGLVKPGQHGLQYRAELGNEIVNCSSLTIMMGNLSLCAELRTKMG